MLLSKLLILLILSSCARTSVNKSETSALSTQEEKKLLESFNVDPVIVEKFQEDTPPVSVPKQPSIQPSSKVTENQTKPQIKQAKAVGPVIQQPKTEVIVTKSQKEYPEELVVLDKSSKLFWQEFSPRFKVGEEMEMDITYLGMNTGTVNITVKANTKVGSNDTYHFFSRVQSSRYYKYIYEVDDTVDSYLDIASVVPVKFELVQRESGQDIDDLQLFDHNSRLAYTFYKRTVKNVTKQKKSKVIVPQYFQDPLSVIFFMRSLELKKGNEYSIPVITSGKILLLKAKVVGTEEIKTPAGKFEAIKVEASSQYTGKTLRPGKLIFWFSNDQKRIPLSIDVNVKFGTLRATLTKYNSK